jgi:hypothetical protein
LNDLNKDRSYDVLCKDLKQVAFVITVDQNIMFPNTAVVFGDVREFF